MLWEKLAKDEQSFLAMVKEVGKSKAPAFDKQWQAPTLFMLERNWMLEEFHVDISNRLEAPAFCTYY